jgi:hypothetical protein
MQHGKLQVETNMNGGLMKAAGQGAIAALTGLLLSTGSAFAADLGGNCCADLEERVAELEATTARKGNRRVSLTISGQVTTHLMYWNDGGGDDGGSKGDASRGSDLYVVDNTVAGATLFSFAGSAKINPNVTAGFQITVSLDVGGRSHQVTQLDDDGRSTDVNPRGGGDTDMVMTLANWYLDHKHLGRVTVGRINGSTAGITTIDLGGAGVIANASIGYWQRGMLLIEGDSLQTATWSTALGGATVNGASHNRLNGVVYTTPTFGGFQFGSTWGENDEWDVSLRYAGEFSGFRVAAGIGYRDNYGGAGESVALIPGHSSSIPTQVLGSASVLHVMSGLYLTGGFLNQDNDTTGRPDTTLWYVQGGISKNWTSLGKTVLYGEYSEVEDGAFGADAATLGGTALATIDSSRAHLWGIGVVQHVDAAAMELYLAYRRFSFDASETGVAPADLNFSDMDVVVGGARIRF